MTNKRVCFAVLLAALSASQGLFAAAAAGRVAAPYLELPMSTRATGMGEAFTGVANDDAALYYNPAGIAQVDSTLASFMHLQGFGDINYEYLGMVTSLENLGVDVWGSVGLSYELIGINPIQRTQATVPGGSVYDQAYADRNFTYTAGGSLLGLSYAWQATKLFSLGGTVKFINQKIDQADGWGAAADLGLYTKPPAIPGLSAGLAIQNMGASPDSTAPLPVNLRLGVGYNIDHIFSKPTRPTDKLLLSADLTLPIVPIDASTRFAIGTEYSLWFAPDQYGALRLGYRLPDDLGAFAGLTTGMGWGMEFPGGTVISLDGAWVPYGELGNSFRISLTGNFGLKKPLSPIADEKEPFGPPKGLQAVGGDRRVQLTWAAPAFKASGYNVYMSYNPAKGQWYKLNQRGLVKGTSVSSGGLYNNYRYYFALTSVQAPEPGKPGKESEKSAAITIIPSAAGSISSPAPAFSSPPAAPYSAPKATAATPRSAVVQTRSSVPPLPQQRAVQQPAGPPPLP